MHAGRPRCPELLPIVVGAVLLRLPTVLSRAPLVFDDSVYLASVGAMREGGLPYRDVFSSQGPAFLPLLWVADLLGLRTAWSPRLLPLLAGVALVVLVHRLALQVGDRGGAALAAILVATSGAVMFTTDRIESDGVAAAFAVGAVLVACNAQHRRGSVAGSAVLLGIALAVKSLFVGPAALAVLWLVGRRHGWGSAVWAGAGAALTTVVLALPWGLGTVWDQYVRLHVDVGGQPDLSRNVSLLREGLLTHDRLLSATVIVAAIAIVVARLRGTATGGAPSSELAIASWIWLGASLVVLLLHDPLFFQHLTLLVPPAALLVARHRPPLVATLAVLVLLLPSHARAAEWRLTRPSPTDDERAMIDLLARVEPRDGLIISDEPALPWLAGRTSPGATVDVSYVRIEVRDLTTDDVVEAAHARDVCAVLLWSGRLDELPGLRAQLTDYRAVFSEGSAELLLRSGCRLRE